MNFNDRNREILEIRFEFIDRATINYLINRLLFNLVCLLLAFIDCIVDSDVTLFVRAIPSFMIDINSATICTVIVSLEDFAILVCEFEDEFEFTSVTDADIVQRDE